MRQGFWLQCCAARRHLYGRLRSFVYHRRIAIEGGGKYGRDSAVGVINCGLPDLSGDDGGPDPERVGPKNSSSLYWGSHFDDCRRTVLQFFSTGSHRYVLLQDFPELTETTAVAQEEYGKTQQEILEKQYGDVLAQQCSDVLAQEGKVLDEIRVACTSQGGDQSIAVKIRSPEEKQEGIQIDLGYIQVGDNSKPEQEWSQAFVKKACGLLGRGGGCH